MADERPRKTEGKAGQASVKEGSSCEKSAARSRTRVVKTEQPRATPASLRPTRDVEGAGRQVQYVRPVRDRHTIDGQRYWVISYVTSETKGIRSREVMVKCSGTFPDEASAGVQAQLIHDEDPRIDVSVVDMYEMLTIPIPADVEPYVRKQYDEKNLDRIMKGCQESMLAEKREIEERMERDRKRALEKMRAVYGKDWTPGGTPRALNEYQKKQVEDRDREQATLEKWALLSAADKKKIIDLVLQEKGREAAADYAKNVQLGDKPDAESNRGVMETPMTAIAAAVGGSASVASASLPATATAAPASPQ